MSWSLFRWVWQLEGPLYVGMPPAGSLNRTRLYVPAHAIWGALTAELSRREALNGKEPQYQSVGESLQKDYRFTYLFPAEKVETTWRAWLPTYRDGVGLSWSREDQSGPTVGDRQLRRRLLSTRPGTSINASAGAVEDGSLRETECIERRWRSPGGCDIGPVGMMGYVFIRTATPKNKYSAERRRLEPVQTLFLGGDARYGLGQVRREEFELIRPATVFGKPATSDAEPQVQTDVVLAHASMPVATTTLRGAVELLGGWERGITRALAQDCPSWQPGSCVDQARHWSIQADGLWSAVVD